VGFGHNRAGGHASFRNVSQLQSLIPSTSQRQFVSRFSTTGSLLALWRVLPRERSPVAGVTEPASRVLHLIHGAHPFALNCTVRTKTQGMNIYTVHSPKKKIHYLLNLEKFKIYIKIYITVSPTCFGLRSSSGSLY
jgi:hypothetical protein